MERTAVNPWSWSVKLGFDQAELVEGHRRELVCSAQDAVDANGNSQHPGDMAAQLGLALDNLEAVLAGADMTLANVVRLNVYTTDMDSLLQHFATTERTLRRRPLRHHPARRRAPRDAGPPRRARRNRHGLSHPRSLRLDHPVLFEAFRSEIVISSRDSRE